MILPVAMVYFWGHLSTKCTFNNSVLFCKYLEYVCSSSGESGLWESKWDTVTIFEHHSLNILFPTPLHIYVHLKWNIIFTELHYFSKLDIRSNYTWQCEQYEWQCHKGSSHRPTCPFQRVPVLCWAPAASLLPPSCQHSQIAASSTFLLWWFLPLKNVPWWMSDQPWWDENPQQKDDNYRLIRPTCSESAVTKCSALRVP